MSAGVAHITPIRGVNDEGKGKKHALHLLIHAAEADVLWLHDDDIVRPEASDQEALARMENVDLLILPLRMQVKNNTLLERMQVIEYAALQQLTVLAAQRGRPVLCSGANLMVRRRVWLQAEEYLHPELPSGDDMFLLEYCKRTGRTIAACQDERMTATVTAQPTLHDLLRQRARWAGKAPHYTDSDIRRCGALVTLAIVMQILCPPIVLLYLPWEYSLVRGKGFSPIEVLLLAVVYPYYALIALISGLLHPKRW